MYSQVVEKTNRYERLQSLVDSQAFGPKKQYPISQSLCFQKKREWGKHTQRKPNVQKPQKSQKGRVFGTHKHTPKAKEPKRPLFTQNPVLCNLGG